MQQVHSIETEGFQAVLQGPSCLRSIEAVVGDVTIDLGRDDKLFGSPPSSWITSPIHCSLRPMP